MSFHLHEDPHETITMALVCLALAILQRLLTMQYAHFGADQTSIIRGALNSRVNLGPSKAIDIIIIIMEVSLIWKATIDRFCCGHMWKLS